MTPNNYTLHYASVMLKVIKCNVYDYYYYKIAIHPISTIGFTECQLNIQYLFRSIVLKFVLNKENYSFEFF